VLLCNPDGTPAETTAGELAEWCGAGRTPLAFLQVCKAGQTAGRGGFGGVAQQLLNPRGGNLAAVVASTFPLDATQSTDAAVGFYRQLAAGRPPGEALTADRPESDWCWAFLELWARPGALGGTQQRAAFQFVSPYRGLSSFAEQDADLFFGRQGEVAELLQLLRAEPALAVVGDSGSGKTSLLQAGLVHAVRRDGLAGSDRWKIVSLRPGYRPAQALLNALAGGNAEPTPEALKAALRADAQPLVVVFDQFEEVFTLARDAAEVQVLTAALADAVESQRERFRLVLGMRSEFLGQAATVKGLSRLIRRPWVLRPPSESDLRAIVGGPAEHCGYTFAPALLDRILADPLLAPTDGGAPAAPLPLLQFALERLWLKAVEKGVTEFAHAEFDEIGGMGKAIAQHAEAVFQASATATDAGPQGRQLAEQIITALVSARGTRQPRGRDALQAETGHPEAARAVVDYLVGERLLTVRSDPEDATRSLVDLSHEVLITNWDRLKGWLAEDPQGRAMREEFRTAAEKWEEGVARIPPRSRSGLPGADVARNYLAWIDTSRPRLAPVQQEFAREMRDMLSRQRARRVVVTWSLASLAFVAILAAAYAFEQSGRAKTNEEKATKSAAKANEEKRTADIESATIALERGLEACDQGRPRLGILSFAHGLGVCPTDAPDMRRVLLTNLSAWWPYLMCLDEVRALPHPIVATDRGGRFAVVSLPARPDEPVWSVQLYDVKTEKPAGPPVATGGRVAPDREYPSFLVTHAVVLPNGTALLSGGGVNRWSWSVWDMTTGKPLGPQQFGHPGGVATLSPDGKVVAATDPDNNIVLYDTTTGTPRADKHPQLGKVSALCFSDDGKYLASGCGRSTLKKGDGLNPDDLPLEGVVSLFAVADGTLRPSWRRATPNAVTCVKISPDNTIVTGGGYELRSWTVGEGQLRDTRFSPENTAHIAFDPDDTTEYIACNPSGGLQILRREEALRPAIERLSPQGWVAGTGFLPDGRVFTANGDGTVRIWNRPWHGRNAHTAGGVEYKPPKAEALLSAAFRPDGKAFALGAKTGVVFLYHTGTDTPKQFVCTATGPAGTRWAVTDLRFSADGTRIVAHDEKLNTFVFDTAGGPDPLPVPDGLVGVAPDGKTVLVRANDGPVVEAFRSRDPAYRVTQIGAAPRPSDSTLSVPGGLTDFGTLAGDGQRLRTSRVAFTPDASVVALLDSGGAVHLFRTATGERVGGPVRHGDGEANGIAAVAFCSRGDTLLTRSPKGRGIWEAKTGAPIHLLSNPIGVQVTRFSPGGKYILGATNFNRAQVWDNSGAEVTPVPLVHAAQVWAVAADPAEERIITASFDRTVRVWDRATGRSISPAIRFRQGVSDAVFSPDGRHALTASWDGTARWWKVSDPVKDEAEWLRAWVQTLTGMKVGRNVTDELLTAGEWKASYEDLMRRGGPPGGTVP
jgi:WD40 repeat protein